jgi:hypothetical protein
MSPIAILGTLKMSTELTPVKSSGKEVMIAINISPNHALPIPVIEVIISLYFDSLAPAKIINAEQATNPGMVVNNDVIFHGTVI